MQPRFFIVLVLFTIGGSSASGQYAPIYGGPTWNSAIDDGYWPHTDFPITGNNAGQAVATASKHTQGSPAGRCAVRFDSAGGSVELQSLPGASDTRAGDINASGMSVGTAILANGARALRWTSSGAMTQLPNLGGSYGGSTYTYTRAINNAGQVAGGAEKWVGYSSKGMRAVRWESGGAVTELATLGTDASGKTSCGGLDVNASGQVCGQASKYLSGSKFGDVAVRWSSSGQATQLQTLPQFLDPYMQATSCGNALNDNGQVAGYATKYVNGVAKGTRAVRWEADGSARELDNLGIDTSGKTTSSATAINPAGQAIGTARKYDGGMDKGERAVRWGSSGAATELQNLGTDIYGRTGTTAYSINSDGEVAGYARIYRAGDFIENHAVLWQTDGSVVDLNRLVDPSSGWVVLNGAYSISDTDWITGVGTFDPDLAGPIAPYNRLFLMHVPEPGSLALFVFGAIGILRRRR